MAELFKLADFYGEVDLKLRCGNQLEILLTVESACAVYAVAVQHDAKVTRHMITLYWGFICIRARIILKSCNYWSGKLNFYVWTGSA